MPIAMEKDGWLLSGQEILAIRQREYHYNAWSSTLLDPYLQPFWRLVVSYIPKYVAPSTLSVCGLASNLIATCITLYFAPTLTEELPCWVSILDALCVFLYQTFDGIDGKQCYRTQCCEVEEYSDHAVDSISVVLNAVTLAAALQLGDAPLLLGMNLTLALSAFYAAHWAAHKTNSLVFGHVDVSEAQFGMIAIHIGTAMGGASFWLKPICDLPLVTFRSAVCWAVAAALLVGIFGNISMAWGFVKTPLEIHGIRIPRNSSSHWPIVFPMALVAQFLLCIGRGLLTSVITVPVILIVGLAMSKLATRLIFQKLAKNEGTLYDASLVLPLFLLALESYCKDNQRLLYDGAWTIVGILTVEVLVFHANVVSDLAQARNINVFTMKKDHEGKHPEDKGFYVCGDNLQVMHKAWQEFVQDEDRFKATYFDVTRKNK